MAKIIRIAQSADSNHERYEMVKLYYPEVVLCTCLDAGGFGVQVSVMLTWR